MDSAFGTSYNRTIAELLRGKWQKGDFSDLPPIQIVDSTVLSGGKGAYSKKENRIYLSSNLIGNVQTINKVIIEEIGHYVDTQINQVDSPGDEGAIFAELVPGNSLDLATLDALRGENDQTIITVNGEIIQVEQANFTGTNGNDNITGTSGDDTISPLRGQDTVNGGGGTDLLILDYSSNNYTGSRAGITSSISGSNSFNGYYLAYTYYINSWDNIYDQVSFSNIERFQITGTVAGDNITTGSGNDIINGGDGNDTISGGSGDDTINGGDGSDTINRHLRKRI
jgi:Ca2+-binding RTX toxin-like protein